MRAFIAIDLDPALKAGLTGLIRKLKKINDRDIAWIREEGMHLTLKFLGEFPDDRIEPLTGLLRETVPKVRTFPLILKGTGRFPPDGRSPRVLWVGVFEQPTLMALQRDLELRLVPLGFAEENRPYQPHLTLGRVKMRSNLDAVLAEMEKLRHSDFGQMTAARVTLFQSTLRPTGAVYTSLAEIPLS